MEKYRGCYIIKEGSHPSGWRNFKIYIPLSLLKLMMIKRKEIKQDIYDIFTEGTDDETGGRAKYNEYGIYTKNVTEDPYDPGCSRDLIYKKGEFYYTIQISGEGRKTIDSIYNVILK